MINPVPTTAPRTRTGRRLTCWGVAALVSLGLIGCGQPAPSPAAGQWQLEAVQASGAAPLAPQQVARPRSGTWMIEDQGASQGTAVILLGHLDTVVFQLPEKFKAGEYTVSVIGRGELYLGAPIIALRDESGLTLGTATLDNTAYDRRTIGRVSLQPGQTLTLAFLNDEYRGPGEDRNAVIDFLLINQSKSGK